ncbi:MAG TPA: right-handed parallel beta-helix repeat-containing protein, partial [Bryobacteraceae bacterium]|nr:right-handed parallel beta-helix repeat-containing protein [Bryobacteraceae bacterium]
MKPVFITPFLFCALAHAATVNIPPEADIQTVVDANPAGTTYQLAAGVYRMQTVTAKDGDQFIGALDQSGNRLTTLSGAQPLTSFTRDASGNYVAATTQTEPGQKVGQCSPEHLRCNLPEDFFYDDEPYVHNSIGAETLTPGQYYFDYPNGNIYFRPKNSGDDPTQHKVEYSRTRSAIVGIASNVTVRNLIVEKYAVPAQFGAIGDQYPGEGWVLQNNETRFNHGAGLLVSSHGQVLGNYTHDNGQLGMGGSGTNILVEGNEIARNNYIGVDHDFECGGFKFAKSDGLIVRNNYSHDNAGPGMWTDISSIRTLYENNLVMNNARSGIFHETSYDAVIRNNMLFNNGSFAPDDWFWNAQLQIAGSQNVEAYGNVVLVNSENNGNGIMLIQQNRSNEPCTYGPCRVMNNFIHDNMIVVTGARWHGSSGGVQDYSGVGDLYAPTSNNRFVSNRYYVTNPYSAAYWQWADKYQTFDDFRSFGLDGAGTVHL